MKQILNVLFLTLIFVANALLFFCVVHSNLTADQCLLVVFMAGLVSIVASMFVVGE